jgi:hypothetical protein
MSPIINYKVTILYVQQKLHPCYGYICWNKVVDAMSNNDQCHDFQQYNVQIFLIFEDVDFDVFMPCPCESILHVYLTKSTSPSHGNLLA